MRHVPDADFGSVPMHGAFPKMSETPLDIAWTGPALGAHTEEILAAWLNMTPGEIGHLQDEDVI